MRRLLLVLAFAPLCLAAADSRQRYLQAVEFPYYLYPRPLWERELVWLKSIGVGTVEFSIPWNWHQPRGGEYDFTGRTSPRRDLAGFIRLLRRLGLTAWVRPLPPAAELVDEGWPADHGEPARQSWLKALGTLLATQTVSHGGPVAWVEDAALAIDAAAPPQPLVSVDASDPAALPLSRAAIASGGGALLWRNVEDSLFPAGWETDRSTLLHKGAVGLDGEERTRTTALRRASDLLREWARVLPGMESVPMPKPAAGHLPEGVTALELTSKLASAVHIANRSGRPFRDDLRVYEPISRRTLVIPALHVPTGEALWLPLGVSLGIGGMCRNCSNFSSAEHIVYATAELHAVEFENGILSMEFAAPVAGEVVLQLARQPRGPFLAAGRPTKFDFDEKTLRARLTVPAGQGPGSRVRIGLAIEAPETSAFFEEARRLLIGRTNVVSTFYSSIEVAARSRLRLPEGWTARPKQRSPVEIDYEIDVPADALHGDWVTLALEADGVLMGRARMQLFRPASIRWTDAIRLRLGPQANLAVEPALAPADDRNGRTIEIVIRNNSTQIQTYQVEALGDGLTFSPARTEISVGAVMERAVSLRVFPDSGGAGLRDWKLRVGGGTTVEMPMRLLLIPRGRTVAWSADLDSDGSPEWVLESQKVRAVFSPQDGGRWIEFTWKDTGVNFLPEGGLWAAPGLVEVRAVGEALEFSGAGWNRTVRLSGGTLRVEQTTPLPADSLVPEKRGTTSLKLRRESPGRVVYALE